MSDQLPQFEALSQNESTGESVPVATRAQTDSLRAEVHQMKQAVVGLGLGFIVVSIALTGFVWRQDRDLSAAVKNRTQQIAQIRENAQRLTPALVDFAQNSRGRPEWEAILQRYGIRFDPNAVQGATQKK